MEENETQIKSGILINVDRSVKNIYVKKIIFGILLHIVANGKYLASIIHSVITCHETIEETKNMLTNFNEKKKICKTQSFYILPVFLLIIIVLLIAVSIYFYLIKYRAKQKRLLPFHVTNNALEMSNKSKDIHITNTQTTFLMILAIQKKLIQKKLR